VITNSDVFPVFTDEMVEEYEQLATQAEKSELETLHGVEKVLNAQDKPQIVRLPITLLE
jgi:hypothetical protein